MTIVAVDVLMMENVLMNCLGGLRAVYIDIRSTLATCYSHKFLAMAAFRTEHLPVLFRFQTKIVHLEGFELSKLVLILDMKF